MVDCAPNIKRLPSKPDYTIKSDTLTMWRVPSVRFLVEAKEDGAEPGATLLAACKEIPAIGKWSRKGNGSVISCTMEPFSGDVWSVAGRVTRALPRDIAESLSLTGVESLEVCRPPYWSGAVEPAVVPTFDPLDSYQPRLQDSATGRRVSRFHLDMNVAQKAEVAQ